jgi:Skp family chaperone for outer membrane proteins
MTWYFTPAGLRVLALSGVLSAGAAVAQTAPEAAPGGSSVTASSLAPNAAKIATPYAAGAGSPAGPLVAGVCLLNREDLIRRSQVGQGVTARLQRLSRDAQSNFEAEKTRIEASGRALEAKRATTPPQELQAQAQALNRRAQIAQQTFAERQQQLEVAKAKAFGRVIAQAQPHIGPAYAAHNCGLLLAGEMVLQGNMGNDLTPEVISAMNAHPTPVSVDLEPTGRGAR